MGSSFVSFASFQEVWFVSSKIVIIKVASLVAILESSLKCP